MQTDLLRDVVFVEPRGGHRILVRFDDGAEGEVDLAEYLDFEGVFSSLADPAYLERVFVDADTGTVSWPNGADLDPVALYCHVLELPFPDVTSEGMR